MRSCRYGRIDIGYMYILIKFLRNKVYLVHGSAWAAKTFTVSILKNLWHYTGNLDFDLYIFIFLYNSRRGKIFNQLPIKYEPLAVPRKVADAPLAFRCKTNICKARPCLKNTIRDGGSPVLESPPEPASRNLKLHGACLFFKKF